MSSTLLNLLNPSQGTKSTLFDLTTLPGVILATGGFILLWSLLKRYVDRRGPIEAIYHIILSHGGLYSLFALAMSVEIVREGSLGPELDDEWLRWIYHFSKFYEYINMLLLVAQGKIVDPYTAFYHLAMPFFTFFRVLKCPHQWHPFGALNCLYTFVSSAEAVGVETLSRPVILFLQFGVGIAVDALWFLRLGINSIGFGKAADGKSFAGGDEETLSRAVGILLLFKLGQLYWQELAKEAMKTNTATAASDQADKGDGKATVNSAKEDKGESKKTR